MKLDRVFPEPLLQFGNGRESQDIRHGITEFGPVDFGTPLQKTTVKVGLVGTPKTISAFHGWLASCIRGIDSSDSTNANFSPAFPGLSVERGLGYELITAPNWNEEITEAELRRVIEGAGSSQGMAELFHGRIAALFKFTSVPPDVVLCLPPESVRKCVKSRLDEELDLDKEDRDEGVDFHDYLKALCLQDRFVFQLIWPRTYKGDKGVQDEATRAWNLFTAIFYKAGGIPWKLAKPPGALNTCYVGISFSRRGDGSFLHSSLTQVFNDKGEGTILKGGLAKRSDEDHEVHLDRKAAEALLLDAINNFKQANSQRTPDRVVVHKSSGFDDREICGFTQAADEAGVRYHDLLALNASKMRFFRSGAYPPLRGTHIILDDSTSLLYTRGSVPFYRKYPGAYVPSTLQIRCFQTDRSQTDLAREILALTKLNWNKTQFDSLFPITLEGSRRIGDIYRWCPSPPSDPVSYALFM